MGDRPSEGAEYPMRLQCVCAFGSSAPSTGVLTAGLRGGVAAGTGEAAGDRAVGTAGRSLGVLH